MERLRRVMGGGDRRSKSSAASSAAASSSSSSSSSSASASAQQHQQQPPSEPPHTEISTAASLQPHQHDAQEEHHQHQQQHPHQSHEHDHHDQAEQQTTEEPLPPTTTLMNAPPTTSSSATDRERGGDGEEEEEEEEEAKEKVLSRRGSSSASPSCSASSSTAITTTTKSSVEDEYLALEAGIDFTCPVCTELLYKPVSTVCGHTFCELCLQMAVSHKPRCPLCREPCLFVPQMKPNVLLVSVVEERFPTMYKERAEEVEAQRARMLNGKKKLIIGNTHQLLENAGYNKHKWKFFIKVLGMDEQLGPATQMPTGLYIDKVEVFLHPSFQPATVVLNSDPFEFTRIGWSTFTIRGNVHFRQNAHRPIGFEHLLSFEKNGTHKAYCITFDFTNPSSSSSSSHRS
ncbi:Lana protein [Balamuthia mandrillaris]